MKIADRLIAIVFIVGLLAAAPPADAKISASIVVDAQTGRVLEAVNPDTQTYPASLTKMMTLYMLFDGLSKKQVTMDSRFRVSGHCASMMPSKLGLAPGQTLTAHDAILAMVTKSANDIACAVGENLGGNEPTFAARMTERSHQLGMRNTFFRNASGVPNPGQKTTARDMSVLARALLRDYPQYYHFFGVREFSYNGMNIINHDHLLGAVEGVDGIKTGFIGASGFNLVTSMKRDGRRLVGVVLGGDSAPARDRHMVQLLNVSFAQLGTQPATMVASNDATAAATTGEGDVEDPPKVAPAPAQHLKKHHHAPIALASAEGSSKKRGWAIQIGAYTERRAATKAVSAARHKLHSLLARTQSLVVPLDSDKGTVYRAQLVGISERQAREACRRLNHHSTSCVSVPPAIGQTAFLDSSRG